jgi:hypothetical protein
MHFENTDSDCCELHVWQFLESFLVWLVERSRYND